MLRSLKYGLTGALVAGAVGATIAWTGTPSRTVHLLVDGQDRTLHTSARTVGELLQDSGYRLDGHDIVAPGAASPLHDGERVVFRRGRLVELTVDGVTRPVWTTAPTVAAAMSDLGLSAADYVSVSRSRRLPLGPTALAVRTPKPVTVVHDGRVQHVDTTAVDVGQLLGELGITVSPTDRLTPPEAGQIVAGERIVITRISTGTVATTERVPRPVVAKSDPNLPLGKVEVVRPGRPGLRRTVYSVRRVDGRLVHRAKVGTHVVRRPVAKVVRRGTELGPDATPAQAQELARSLLGDYGFDGSQMGCLITLWDHESSWNVTAENSGSGAYGIPQALPGSKMASAGPNWQTDAETQIRWGLEYIRARYGTPCGAWATWQAHGGWY